MTAYSARHVACFFMTSADGQTVRNEVRGWCIIGKRQHSTNKGVGNGKWRTASNNLSSTADANDDGKDQISHDMQQP